MWREAGLLLVQLQEPEQLQLALVAGLWEQLPQL
jgi:hypothetical protein